MKKIKWQDVKSQFDNDCWAIAISKATGKTYKEIYNLFKPFKYNCGSLSNGYVLAFLEDNGYTKIDVKNQTVADLLQTYDTNANEIVIRFKNNEDSGHVFYVYQDTIYDNIDIEYRGTVYDKQVDYILYKPKN